MAPIRPDWDERFREEVRRARRLFFFLLPVTLVAISASWALSAGLLSGSEIATAAEDTFSSVYSLFGGGAR